ncbi:hypothetical protein QO010_002119 [Caulobacter ginsengisoli]|uniref:Lipoprotein n=1 Tax=Caulobacter ginsengisoli TaxID=400775 RepID=A0ABU0IT46_9CAUL|nr:hypothetical protein [Caulobacter ginsengisoli]MDQ0464338.1 hypothetical protein [Caulobacter ginsengisoli]
MQRVLILTVAALTLVACASTPSRVFDPNSAPYQLLFQDCAERGGVLTYIPGANSPDDSENYTCKFADSRTKPAG